MENSHIEEWDLRGWMGVEDPTPHAQREWNKTLLQKINLISNKIQQSSLRGGADTIIVHPDLEVLFHPDHYDDFRKKLMDKFNVILDPTVDRSRIELKPISSCDEEDIVKYIEGLVGFVLIENI